MTPKREISESDVVDAQTNHAKPWNYQIDGKDRPYSEVWIKNVNHTKPELGSWRLHPKMRVEVSPSRNFEMDDKLRPSKQTQTTTTTPNYHLPIDGTMASLDLNLICQVRYYKPQT